MSEPIPPPTLELLWQQDATAFALVRTADGTLSAGQLALGMPAVADLAHLGRGTTARRLSLREVLDLAASLSDDVALGGTAQAVLAVVDRARRSVAEGLVHPHLEASDGRWHALWGATLDGPVQEELDAIAAATPPVCADAFDGDPEAFVQDLFACAVDEIARGVLRDAGVRLGSRAGSGAEALLAGLTADDSTLASAPGGHAATARRLTTWVDEGLERLSPAPWSVGLSLDERPGRPGEEPGVVLEAWLHAADDPTLALPASLLRERRDDVFAFVRASDPRSALRNRLATIAPLLADAGIELDPERPAPVELDADGVRALLGAVPRLEEHGVPVLLPPEWVSRQSRVRVTLDASAPPRASGLLGTGAIARFDWKLAIGDVELTEAELTELAAAKEPLIRLRGRWHALRAEEVERALRFLERRRTDAGVVELARAVSGLETDEAGVELGDVRLDATLAELLADGDDRRFRPLPTPAGMRHDLFPFQERGHGWLRLLGDLGVGAILADDMGLGKTVQAIAMLSSERDEPGGDALAPTLVVCPMSVVRQWERELERFAPGLRVHVHHGATRPTGPALAAAARAADVVLTSYDVATRDAASLALVAWDRLVLDEAQDVKNPATKRYRAIRSIPRRRALAMTGTPIENRLGELWAIMELVNPGLLGSRERFDRAFARPIETWGDDAALERLRAIVRPFVLRRRKDDPEIDLELPRISIAKVPCTLTVEQAALYRATVDRWLPRIAERDQPFGRRGAVLAMLSQLKQVCNHPEMVAPTGRPLEGRSGKLERLVALLEAVPDDDRALVFTQFPGFDRLVPHLARRLDREVGFFHGGLGAARRQELLDRFAAEDGPRVMVVSLRAGGRGLNLPAANHVFHFDRWWNPAVEQQATDRAYRFGQRKDVFVHSLICTATLEERIDAMIDAKRELAEKVVAGRADDWLGDLDLDTIRDAVALTPEAVEDAA